jgi:hypothetical protein
METEIRVRRIELLIENGNEMEEYVKNLSAINEMRDKNGLPALFACAKEERTDLETGKTYSILAVYKMGLGSSPTRPVLVQEVIPVDENGNILQEEHQIKKASAIFHSTSIEKYQKIRGMKLRAQHMNASAGKFKFGKIKRQERSADETA